MGTHALNFISDQGSYACGWCSNHLNGVKVNVGIDLNNLLMNE